MKVSSLLLSLLLTGCFSHRMFKKDYITLSESPCVDGTILNIDQAGCESFYWGTDSEMIILKIRCTYAPEDSFWSRSTFYAVPHSHDIEHSNWSRFCQDRYVSMYTIPTGLKLEDAEVR